MDCAEKLARAPSSSYRMRRWKIGHGDSAIHKTILHMQSLVIGPEGVGNPQVRVKALEAVRGSVKNIDEIDSVLAWVKHNIEFRGENAETLQSPVVTLQLGAGDCDDHSILIAALLRSVGYNVQFKTVAAARAAPDQFSHVYVVAQDKRTGQWKGLDSTVPHSFAGWEPPVIYRSKTYSHPRLGDGSTLPDQSTWTPAQQEIYDVASPLIAAAASRLTYGTNPPIPVPVVAAPAVSGNISTTALLCLLAIGGGIFLYSRSK